MDKAPETLRLGFAGTPAFAAFILQALITAEHIPAVIYTQPDRPSGRGRKTRASPVKLIAQTQGIPLEQPVTLKDAAAPQVLSGYRIDVLVVAAYGLILPRAILDAPARGCINVHASLLPRWRGAAPIERAIIAGDEETGVSIMKMDAGLDTGPVYETRACPIDGETDAPALEQALAELGSAALLHCLKHLDQSIPVPQSNLGITYAPKLTRSDAAIHWGESAISIERQVRALKGRMPAFANCGKAQLRVLKAETEPAGSGHQPSPGNLPGHIVAADGDGIRVACGTDILRISQLQLSLGKGKPLSAADALNGYPQIFSAGCVLDDGQR